MKKMISGGVEWLEFKLLREFPQISHAVFLRGADFNLGEQGSEEDQELALDMIGAEKGIKLKQCHQADILEIKEAQEGWTLYEDYDGMVTREKGVALMVRHADCQAAIFFDPESEVIANVHCGWRGSVKNIYRETIQKMRDLYGTNPQELRVCISPSLGPQKAEFKHYESELPPHFWQYQVMPTYFDFWAISRQQLREEGVLQKNIEIAGICTYSNPIDCFSYRRDKPTGHHGTVVALKSEVKLLS
ncbi:peptidoglycan editing factor PgeF [Simkania negevensis]|uniref:Purine nucleoside phosphorylase n=1 Tax=Simkania negevensis (strain ATCC VR-1471 / DSM 27360 / Z) TaxID=331113 RepID=F8L5Y8_SIMNZ|nr:peptidoglycan editing factor PgeF [Simkania negevensis]CCB88133.1 hypothetical protein, putative type III secreted [Simkania negevensis Z]